MKTLVEQAAALLGQRQPPLGKDHAFELMQPIWRLLGTDDFWQDRRAHRAIFLAPGFFTELFLPHPTKDAVYVGSEFLIRPQLVPPSAKSYFVLALHSDRVRLFEGDGFGLRPSGLELPKFDDVLHHDVTAAAEGANTNLNGDHGHPRGSGDAEHTRIKAYYHVVAALFHAQHPNAQEPVILVGTARNLAMFRAVARRLANIEIQTLATDPDSLSLVGLARRVSKLAQPYLSREWEESLRRLHEHKDRIPVDREISSIVEEAIKGQIETLWLARDAQAWGLVGGGGVPNLHAVEKPGDEDLLNFAAVHVLRHQGHVFEVEEGRLEPGVKAIAALRYLTDRYQTEMPRAALANGGPS